MARVLKKGGTMYSGVFKLFLAHVIAIFVAIDKEM
jgi:hypothetical protein